MLSYCHLKLQMLWLKKINKQIHIWTLPLLPPPFIKGEEGPKKGRLDFLHKKGGVGNIEGSFKKSEYSITNFHTD